MVAIVVGAGGAVAHRVQSHDVVDGGRRGSAKNAHRRVCLGEEEVKKVICLTMFYETVWREIAVARGTRKGWKVGNKITLLGSFTLHIINLYFGCVREEPL